MRELFSFLGVGALATAVQYAVYALGLALTAWPAAASSAAGYLCGSLVSYMLNYHVTFQSQRRHVAALPRFYAMVAAAFAINTLAVALLVDAAGWNAWVGQVAATLVCLAFNYAVSRTWVFRGIQ